MIPKVHSATPIISTANNFDIVILESGSITFQHVAITNVIRGFNVTLTTVSGGINGSSGQLTMYPTSGILRFTSQNTTSFTLTASDNSVTMRVNGVRYFTGVSSIAVNDNVVIEWGSQGIDYILVSMGLLGLGIMILTPVYATYQVKVKKNYIWFVYAIAMMSIGYGFVMGWFGG